MKAPRVLPVAMVVSWTVLLGAGAASVALDDVSVWVVVIVMAGAVATVTTAAVVLPRVVARVLPSPLASYLLGARHAAPARHRRLRAVRDDTPGDR